MNGKLADVTSDVLAECLKMVIGLPVRKTASGAEVQLQDGWCHCQVDIKDVTETEDGVMSTALVKIALSHDLCIENLIVGMGTDVSSACISAIQQFVEGMVLPIAALNPGRIPQHEGHADNITFKTVKYAGIDWILTMSEVISNDATGGLYSVVDQAPPVMIAWNSLQYQIDKLQPHWASVYLCKYPAGELDGEVFVDNLLDQRATEELLKFAWPTDQELIWFRQFCYLAPAGYKHIFVPPTRSLNPKTWFR